MHFRLPVQNSQAHLLQAQTCQFFPRFFQQLDIPFSQNHFNGRWQLNVDKA